MSGGSTKRRRRNDDGAVMVEFALILPILVMLLVGILEFGQAYSAKVAIQGAAREGARVLALGRPGDVCSAVTGVQGLANLTCADVAIVGPTCPNPPNPLANDYARVRVSYNFTFAIPFIPLGSRRMTAESSMRCGL